ncbi:MAG: hypothetical protein ACKO7M_12470 [Acinetobacter junii]|jgi:hypothetical protein|uniref:Transmembrane protein n=4 Tax=Acinetobacter TaxID=469 RepID=A0A2R4UKM0_ACIJU|nr:MULTISPECIES: hypothetical protein [Acinetobacter]MBY3624590.1 hypothetical protein [Acinetobacter sp. CUI P1]APU47320.1 hypothetical protein BVL33_01615 [Acinetobacter junii]AWA46610.1 hypothetical protein CDG57_00440 [Acinetobacter junii]EEY92708.1 hypothetical protein HMPREF0026_02254 [Acinetobacter junii SH205]ENV51193.1 hypothetical protein F953_01465 [Acinetobacter junii CIP 107470 = MTCC 11364]
MGQDNIEQHRRYVAISYVFMFLALFTILFAAFAYMFARKVAIVDNAEVWIHAHALWIMRNVLLFIMMAFFASLWFIPLFFFAWDSAIWVTATTVAGVVFSSIAWLFLLNAWLKGLSKYLKNKAVF